MESHATSSRNEQPPTKKANIKRESHESHEVVDSHETSATCSHQSQYLIPIENISSYISRWSILGQCTTNDGIREIHTRSKDIIKVFNFELTDVTGNSIRISAFSEVAEKIAAQVHLGHIYYLTNCVVKSASNKFNFTGHDYELVIKNSDTCLKPAPDVHIEIPPLSISAVPLNNVIEFKFMEKRIDVLAVIDKIEPIEEFYSKKKCTKFVKRDIQLIDATGTTATLILWFDQAREFPEDARGHVIGIKGAMLREFKGELSLTRGCRLELDPPLKEADVLLGWYNTTRPTIETTQLTTIYTTILNLEHNWRFLHSMASLRIGLSEAISSRMTVICRIFRLNSDTALYQACSSKDCQTMVFIEDHQYMCKNCRKSTDSFEYRYMFQAEIFDCTGYIWVTLFNKAAEQLLGKTALEMAELREEDSTAYNDVFQQIRFKPLAMKIRAKSELYKGEQRTIYTVLDVSKPDFEHLLPIYHETLRTLTRI